MGVGQCDDVQLSIDPVYVPKMGAQLAGGSDDTHQVKVSSAADSRELRGNWQARAQKERDSQGQMQGKVNSVVSADVKQSNEEVVISEEQIENAVRLEASDSRDSAHARQHEQDAEAREEGEREHEEREHDEGEREHEDEHEDEHDEGEQEHEEEAQAGVDGEEECEADQYNIDDEQFEQLANQIFNNSAAYIQKIWRGYYVRKLLKQYLQGLEEGAYDLDAYESQ